MKDVFELKPILKTRPTEKELCKSLPKANFSFFQVFIYSPLVLDPAF
jgi:hypothetical protein